MRVIKIIIIPILTIAILFISYCAFSWLKYSRTLDKEEGYWVNKIFKPKQFTGLIYELNRNDTNNCFSNLIILIGQEKFASGVCLCDKNKEFSDFAFVGDTIIKKANSLRIVIIKKNSKEQKEFYFPFCD